MRCTQRIGSPCDSDWTMKTVSRGLNLCCALLIVKPLLKAGGRVWARTIAFCVAHQWSKTVKAVASSSV